jgi:GPH family glycoside/pentoside/hexuronide:cation symporter
MFIAVLPFLFTWVLKVSYSYLGLYFLAQGSMLLVSQPLWVPLAKRWGKKRMYYAATLMYALAMLTWLAAGPGESGLAIVLRGLFTGTAGGGLLLIGQSMLPDTMEYDYRRSGERREGLFAGIYTTVEKISFSIGPALTGIVLGMSGYIASAPPGTVQPESAKTAMYVCLAVLPAIVTIAGALLLSGYRLDEQLMRDLPEAGAR